MPFDKVGAQWHVSKIQKSHPIWMRLKVEVKSPLSVLCDTTATSNDKKLEDMINYFTLYSHD